MKLVRRLRGLFSGLRLLWNPNRLTDVFVLEEALSDEPPARAIIERVRQSPDAADAIVGRRRLATIDLARLRRMPKGSLGRTFADHVGRLGIDPASMPRHEAVDDEAFVRAHLYETHDIWHVLLGFDTDVAGELGVQAFYAAQVGGALAPWLIVGGLVHALVRERHDFERRLQAVVRGWSLGKTAKPLFGLDWDRRWASPLSELRNELALEASCP